MDFASGCRFARTWRVAGGRGSRRAIAGDDGRGDAGEQQRLVAYVAGPLRVDPHRADKFYAAVRKYWPALKDGTLQPGYAGIRPKIVPPGAPAQDFTLQGPAHHGVTGLINLFGIESPGLTASLALAEDVRALAGHS